MMADLDEAGDVGDEMKRARVEEDRGDETPPLAVRRSRPDAAAPANERVRIAQGAGAEEHAGEHHDVQSDEGRRHERPGCPLTEGVAERPAFRLEISGTIGRLPGDPKDGSKESSPLVRRGEIVERAE